MSKAKRKAKKEIREKTAIKKTQAKANVRGSQIDAAEKRSKNRISKRTNASATRVNKRSKMSTGRIGKRLGKKYGKFDPEETAAVMELAPLTPAMSDALDAQGVEHDHSDPLEIATKYVQLNPELGDPLDDATYDDAFVNSDDHYIDEDGLEPFEHFDWKKTALAAVKGAAVNVQGELQKNVNDIRTKENNGQPLTDVEKKILKAANSVRGGKNELVSMQLQSSFRSAAPIAIILLILFVILK